MISALFLPSARRRSMYATVRGSCWPRRVIAIRQSALFARRLPPWLRRNRLYDRPLCTGTGATPQIIAQAASLRIRSGLSPAAINSSAAVSIPTP